MVAGAAIAAGAFSTGGGAFSVFGAGATGAAPVHPPVQPVQLEPVQPWQLEPVQPLQPWQFLERPPKMQPFEPVQPLQPEQL